MSQFMDWARIKFDMPPAELPSFNCAEQVRILGFAPGVEAFRRYVSRARLVEAYRRAHPESCKPWAALAAVHAAKHLRVKCGSFAARRYAEKRGASALMYQIAEEFEERRSRKCK